MPRNFIRLTVLSAQDPLRERDKKGALKQPVLAAPIDRPSQTRYAFVRQSVNTLELIQQQSGGAILVPLKRAASFLGLEPQTIRNQLCEGRCVLSPVRIGTRIFFKAEDIANRIDALALDIDVFGRPRPARGRPTKAAVLERKNKLQEPPSSDGQSLVALTAVAPIFGRAPKSIQNQISLGRWPIPIIKIGKHVYFRAADVVLAIKEDLFSHSEDPG